LAPVVSRASANIQYHHQLKRIASTQSDGPLLGHIDGHYEMLLENPFDSNIKRMSTVWQFIPEDTRNDPADYELVVCE
jgi:P-type Na+/K+ transporter